MTKDLLTLKTQLNTPIDKPVLLIDMSQHLFSLGIAYGTNLTYQYPTSNSTHFSGLCASIGVSTLDTLIKQEGLEWHDIQTILIVEGPGSFTGIRISFSIVNTLQVLNLKAQCFGTHTLLLYAHKYFQEHPLVKDPIWVCLKADNQDSYYKALIQSDYSIKEQPILSYGLETPCITDNVDQNGSLITPYASTPLVPYLFSLYQQMPRLLHKPNPFYLKPTYYEDKQKA